MGEMIGVFVCAGCGIGQSLDCDAIGEAVSRKFGDFCGVVKTLPIACGPAGVKEIRQDLEENDLDGALICACSPRMKWDVFQFPETLVERANIREFCAWSHQEPGDGVAGTMQPRPRTTPGWAPPG